MVTVYALYNQTRDKIYIGITANLGKRIARHNRQLSCKKSSFTYKNSGNWKLIHKEIYNNRAEALKREKQLKSYQGRKFIRSKCI